MSAYCLATIVTLLLQQTVTGVVECREGLRGCARTAAQTAALRTLQLPLALPQALRDAGQPLPGGSLVHDPADVSLHGRILTVTRFPLLALLLARLLRHGVEPGGVLPPPCLRPSPQLPRGGEDGVVHLGQTQLLLLKRGCEDTGHTDKQRHTSGLTPPLVGDSLKFFSRSKSSLDTRLMLVCLSPLPVSIWTEIIGISNRTEINRKTGP